MLVLRQDVSWNHTEVSVRIFGAIVLSSVLSGCGVLDQFQSNQGPQLDPNKVYIGTSRLSLRSNELDRYACVDGPLLCTGTGTRFDCRCPQ